MKPSTSDEARRYNSRAANVFLEAEIEVAEILLDLPNLIAKSESRRRGFSVSWVTRKRRSVPSPRRVVEAEAIRPKVKVESTSPSTPLCFYPSESDEKSKHSLKRKREVENERSRCNNLKSINLTLKAKKQEVSSSCVKKEKPRVEMGKKSLNLEIKLDQHYQNPMFAHHQQQLIVNQTSTIYESQTSGVFQFTNHGQMAAPFLSSKGGGSGMVNHVGPLGIPDLNLCLEEAFGLESSSQPLDWSSRVLVDDRVMCAEARRRRMMKIKEMKKQQRGR